MHKVPIVTLVRTVSYEVDAYLERNPGWSKDEYEDAIVESAIEYLEDTDWPQGHIVDTEIHGVHIDWEVP